MVNEQWHWSPFTDHSSSVIEETNHGRKWKHSNNHYFAITFCSFVAPLISSAALATVATGAWLPCLHAFLTPSFVNSAHDSSNHHIVVPCSNDIFLQMRWFNFDSMYTHYWSNTKVLLATSSSSSVTTKDSLEEIQSIASWKSTSPTAKEAAIIYRAPSILDQNAHLEVKKRIGGAG